jgi:hypothetical protein
MSKRTARRVLPLHATVVLLVALASLIAARPASAAPNCVALSNITDQCGMNTQLIAGPDGARHTTAYADVYFLVVKGHGKVGFAHIYCLDGAGDEVPCRHIYAKVVIRDATSHTTGTGACGHSAPACHLGGLVVNTPADGNCARSATAAIADPINVELPTGNADNGNRVGSFTVTVAC